MFYTPFQINTIVHFMLFLILQSFQLTSSTPIRRKIFFVCSLFFKDVCTDLENYFFCVGGQISRLIPHNNSDNLIRGSRDTRDFDSIKYKYVKSSFAEIKFHTKKYKNSSFTIQDLFIYLYYLLHKKLYNTRT